MKKLTMFIVLCMVFVMQPTQCFAENYWDKNYIGPREYLAQGEGRRSENRDYKLNFQQDGNLVLLKWANNSYSQVLWASNSFGKGGTLCHMQEDGNLVIYTKDKKPIWATNTSGYPGAFLVLQDDGNLVLYKDNQRKQDLWDTNTNGK